MTIVAASIALVPGLALGSFVTVVASRVPERRSVVRPGSACDACAAPVAWYDNLPVLSYVLLRGRCRGCRGRIPVRYPAIEAVTAALVAGSFLVFGATVEAVVAALFCAVLVTLTVTDLEHRIVPNRIVLPAAVAALVARTALAPSVEWALGAAAAAGFLLVAALAYPGGMGMGDVKLALLLGAVLGQQVGVALMVAFLAALVPSAVILARHGSRGRKLAIPFAPFLALGGVVAVFAGDELLDAYLARF